MSLKGWKADAVWLFLHSSVIAEASCITGILIVLPIDVIAIIPFSKLPTGVCVSPSSSDISKVNMFSVFSTNSKSTSKSINAVEPFYTNESFRSERKDLPPGDLGSSSPALSALGLTSPRGEESV